MLYPQSRIIVFAKSPVRGTVKTRLISEYGESFATELHCAMLWHSLFVISQADICPIELWCSPDVNHPFFDTCVDAFDITLHVQRGKDLGEKMKHAFDTALKKADHALIIGTDCPSLQSADFVAAMDNLIDGADVVINPATDGGYVMLGQSQSAPTLFEDIKWGSSSVFEQTLSRIKTAKLECCQLAIKRDVDLADDVKYLAANSQNLNLHSRLSKVLNSN